MTLEKNKAKEKKPFFWGLKTTIITWFLVLAIVPMSLVGVVSYLRARADLEASIERNLLRVANLKHARLEQWANENISDLKAYAELQQNVSLLTELRNAFNVGSVDLSKFVNSYQWENIVLDRTDDLKSFNRYKNYHDVLFIDDKGNILFSIAAENDLGTNLHSGKYAGTLFAKAYQKSMTTGQTVFSDLEHYAPSKGMVSGFFTTPMFDKNGDKAGVLALQITTEEINNIVKDAVALGTSGISYLVGWSKEGGLRFKSNIPNSDTPTILTQAHETTLTRSWIEDHNQKGQEGKRTDEKQHHHSRLLHYTCMHQHAAFGVHEDIDIAGVSWALVVEREKDEAFTRITALRNIVALCILLTALGAFVAARILTRRLTAPITALSQTAKKVAVGELVQTTNINAQNEIGEMAQSFNRVVENLKKVVFQANTIASGDFSNDVTPLSDKDEMGTALKTMIKTLRHTTSAVEKVALGDLSVCITEKSDRDLLAISVNKMVMALKQSAEKDQKTNWLKNGQTELAEKMRGNKDLPTLSRDIVTHIAKYLNAQVGTFYVADDAGTLSLAGSYAFTRRKNLEAKIKLGEGIVGQAALEQQPIILANIPDDYVHIASSLGETAPKSIIALPLIMDNRVEAVIELATLTSFTEQHISLLEMVADTIAITIRAAKETQKTQTLLETTQAQATELKTQQEKLKASNEELEEQTQLLRSSEEELKQQSEELQASNEELEEKTIALNEQKKELEEKGTALEDKARDLELASKYKSEFLANMSHELRTPLNSLLILAKNLIKNEDGNLNTQQIEDCEVIYNGGRDLLELINEILDLSKVEAGKLEFNYEEVGFDQIIETIKSQMGPFFVSKNLEFIIQKAKDLPTTLVTDKQRVEQIIKNLLSNAGKFTKEGSVTLKMFAPGKRRHDRISGDYIAFAVTDTGIGIRKEMQSSIFESFQQADGSTSRVYGGTGLGLTISRELAKKLGGYITLESEVNVGSTFTVFIPSRPQVEIIKQGPAKIANTVPAVPVATGQPETLMDTPIPEFVPDDRDTIREGDKILVIIEDDPAFAKELIRLSRKKGDVCAATNSGRAGLALVDRHRPVAVLLDLGLPDMHGDKVLKALKENPRTAHCPVHIISSEDSSNLLTQLGAAGQLTKPVSEEDLQQVFAKLQGTQSDAIKNVLIIEDDHTHSQAMSRLLGSKSLNVTTAATGSEALNAVKAQTFDCIILDLKLPDMTGFELLKEFKSMPAFKTPVIVYTGKSLSKEEHDQLKMYTGSVILKEAESFERLKDDVSLFLHSVDQTCPSKNKVAPPSPESLDVLKEKTILLADDDMRNVYALNRTLKGYKLETVVAANGKKALEIIDTHKKIDLVLMDVMMPEMDGLTAIKIIREKAKFKNLPIIALTAKAMSDDKGKCIEAGANDYLTKPVDTDKLISMISVWLSKT
ncbi:MAG: response regulator [Deltaproteobacteria bacterium]|nr:response regulator [Deltaproteobacteria bacterium]